MSLCPFARNRVFTFLLIVFCAFVCFSLFLHMRSIAHAQDLSSRPGEYIAYFRDREIDLEPFLLGIPYRILSADLEHGQVLYTQTTPDGKQMRLLTPKGGEQVAFSDGKIIGNLDWSKRRFRKSRFHPPTGKMFIRADEKNDEKYNIYAMDLADGSLEQITFSDYIYAWGFSKDYKYLAYVSRSGKQKPFISQLRIQDLETGSDREIICDNGGDDCFTWSRIAFTADNENVILEIQHDGDRRLTTWAMINLTDSGFDFLTPPRTKHRGLNMVENWVSDTEFLYSSSLSGFRNIYRYDLSTRTSYPVTQYDEDVSSFNLAAFGEQVGLLVFRLPHESRIELLDIRTGEILHKETVPANAYLVDFHKNTAFFVMTSLTSPMQFIWHQYEFAGETVSCKKSTFAEVPADIEQKLVHCASEKVSYPTFDKINDGTPRELHGFYLEPLQPPDNPVERLVLIRAFYGGSNNYSLTNHVFGAAGIASFSPAPRGSNGFGADFKSLNDGDLGGDEIVDIIYAARWLMKEKGYQPHQIGVHGGSHGGYAAMRCLTFPPETNGRNESFDFGFGISHAGFFDIISFFESSNIPDWVLMEAGDPITEREKLLDRSPISHVNLLDVPIMLTHGRSDKRVPVTESQRFVQKARELEKDVTYIEFDGQGHGIGGIENLLHFYQVQFDFLQSFDQN